jgi:esterase/lipase superfamily enzyme
MRRDQIELTGDGLDRPGLVIRYGHWGRPVLVFPSEQGHARDFENNGMITALGEIIDGGRAKVYCVDSFDHLSWSNRTLALEDRARAHQRYETWIVDRVLPWILHDCPGFDLDGLGVVTTGCGLGAYHALSLTLKRADVFPRALCLSGSYDPSRWHAWGEPGEQAYFTNPTHFVANTDGDHLQWLRSRVYLVLVVGQGPWETHSTRSLQSTRLMADLLQDKDIPHELDVRGPDDDHDWPYWQRQTCEHLPKFC